MTTIYHIITNSLLHRTINTGKIKLDMNGTEKRMTPERKVKFIKHLINNKTKEEFKNALQEMAWDSIISSFM